MLDTVSIKRHLYHNDKIAYLALGLICASIILGESHEIFEVQKIYNGYLFVEQRIEPTCSWSELPYQRGGINWYLVCASYLTFGNSQVIPFLISLGVLPVTFLFVRKHSNNLIAILSTAWLAITPEFIIFDSVAAYAQSWALFFLASMYFMKDRPIISALFFNLAVLCKAIPLAWAPFLIGMIAISNTPKKQKMLYCAAIGLSTALYAGLSALDGSSPAYGLIQFKPLSLQSYHDAITWIFGAFRWDIEMIFITPILFVVFFLKRKAWNLNPLPFELLGISMISMIAISMFTVEGYFPYRIIPNVVMFIFSTITILEAYVKHRKEPLL